MTTPEERARETIDTKLAESGWIMQIRDRKNTVEEGAQGSVNVSQTSCKTEAPFAQSVIALLESRANGERATDYVRGVLVFGG